LRPLDGNKFANFETASKALEPQADWWKGADAKSKRSLPKTLLLEALGTCHGITFVNDALIGDPLDVQMF